MKEGISYSFLLNIIILFIFVCASIITGIFSYYRAFRANTIIVDEIEKYEGYNCLSEKSISKKLNNISYNVPFDVECKDNYGDPCLTDNNNNYAVVAYNIDFSDGTYIVRNDSSSSETDEEMHHYDKMNSKYECTNVGSDKDKIYDCSNTKKYQFGVYTFMYLDLPVVSNLLKIPIFSKTKIMYDYRNVFYHSNGRVYDSRFLPNEWRVSDGWDTVSYGQQLLVEYTEILSGNLDTVYFGSSSYNARDAVQHYAMPTNKILIGYAFSCGYQIDYSEY